MKFTIEVLRFSEGAEEVLAREQMNAIAPKWVCTRAQTLLTGWKTKGATGVRILNREGHPVYSWTV